MPPGRTPTWMVPLAAAPSTEPDCELGLAASVASAAANLRSTSSSSSLVRAETTRSVAAYMAAWSGVFCAGEYSTDVRARVAGAEATCTLQASGPRRPSGEAGADSAGVNFAWVQGWGRAGAGSCGAGSWTWR